MHFFGSYLNQQRILFYIKRMASLVLYQQDDNSKYIECAKKLHSVPIIVLFPHILPHYFCHNCTAGSRICGSFEIVLIKTDTNMGSHVNGFLIKIMHYFGWTCLEQFILFYSKKNNEFSTPSLVVSTPINPCSKHTDRLIKTSDWMI